ncbi:inosine/xanthosine triphosphatase [Tepidibacillus sp. HK-1]|uniref:inosine/xanthosine triphosphatase n=1 Tax=Tepidibacillus sp. HK-1 TaxID=1883407 RepID=UPI00085847FD|nr:inosine/xanthosine triphosphatase [Tepidibacillus sp. HK-1]GBF11101.1 non-canonical purine NTP phosphatase [Tepidibacillus sp. HK-1]
MWKLVLHIGVGSKNPAKIEAVRSAFAEMGFEAEVIGLDVESQVSEQPFSDEETIQGAINRANNVMFAEKELHFFDYCIGLEGGVIESPFGMFLCNWGVVVDKEGNVGIGGGLRVQLPEEIANHLRMGKELGDIIDDFTGKHNVKKKEGTIGILTNQLITRKDMFRDVTISAFARFLNPQLYEEN